MSENNELSLRRSQPVRNIVGGGAIIAAAVGLVALFLPLSEAQQAGVIGFVTLVVPYVAAEIAKRRVTPNEYVAAEVIKTRVVTARDGEGRPSEVEVKPIVVAGPASPIEDGMPVYPLEPRMSDVMDETGELAREIPDAAADVDPGPYTEPEYGEDDLPVDRE